MEAENNGRRHIPALSATTQSTHLHTHSLQVSPIEILSIFCDLISHVTSCLRRRGEEATNILSHFLNRGVSYSRNYTDGMINFTQSLPNLSIVHIQGIVNILNKAWHMESIYMCSSMSQSKREWVLYMMACPKHGWWLVVIMIFLHYFSEKKDFPSSKTFFFYIKGHHLWEQHWRQPPCDEFVVAHAHV